MIVIYIAVCVYILALALSVSKMHKEKMKPECFATGATMYPVSLAENGCADCEHRKECATKDGSIQYLPRNFK